MTAMVEAQTAGRDFTANRPPRFEILTTCVGFEDVLALTLPHTTALFGHHAITIVTTPDDRDTQRLCHKFGVRCLPTDEFHRHGAPFDKARAIRYGWMHLRQTGWIIHMDADIVLPPTFHGMLAHHSLDPSCIYGIDRIDCNVDQWREYLAKPELQYEWSCIVKPPSGWRLGARLVHPDFGWVPIGYFQMWHGSTGRRYPDRQGTAEHTDLLHSLQWPHEKRRLIPELLCVHVDVASGKPWGANWAGRKTPKVT
jgi:hypothetical protein